MGYPGTISLRLETYSALIRDICAAVSRHGFRRVLIVNGHGGNVAILGATALQMSEELGLFVGVASYWHLIVPQLREIGTSELGGMGHACEMETSLQLHLRPELVSMADARKDMPRPLTSFSGIDFRDLGPVGIALDFRRDSIEGVMGDPTVATSEKGEAIAAAVLEELGRAIDAFREAPLDRRARGRGPVRFLIPSDLILDHRPSTGGKRSAPDRRAPGRRPVRAGTPRHHASRSGSTAAGGRGRPGTG